MWVAPVLAIAAVISLALLQPASLLVAMPILVLWLISPGIAWWISRPLARHQAKLSIGQTRFLRIMARKTWAFFETFVGPEDHWLPPDNFQEHPKPVVAHRTSPTNMGLSLLANLTAYDFGYIGSGKLIERTANALRTMDTLERYRGHFYNWYDTQSLKPLLPRYISSVDSGNLAGHLLILRQGLLALADDPILGRRFFEGLRDTLACAVEAAEVNPEEGMRFTQLHQKLAAAVDAPPTQLSSMQRYLAQWATEAEAIVGTQEEGAEIEDPVHSWTTAFVRQCRDGLDELLFLAPWLETATVRSGSGTFFDLERIPTLRELAALEMHLQPALEEHRTVLTSPEAAGMA
jgi:cyclic beta-1,2-glucan synthetase